LRRCCPKNWSRFAASEEPRHVITFQGREGAKPIIIRQTCGEVGESHVNHQALYKPKTRCACQRARCDSTGISAERFRIRSTGKARTRGGAIAKAQRRA